MRLPIQQCPPGSARIGFGDERDGPAAGPFVGAPIGPAPTGRPFVLWIQVVALDSPDTLELVGASLHARRIDLELEHRDFEGLLGGNVPECGSVRAELPSLDAGDFEVRVTLTRRGFTRLDRPSEAEFRETSETRHSFRVE